MLCGRLGRPFPTLILVHLKGLYRELRGIFKGLLTSIIYAEKKLKKTIYFLTNHCLDSSFKLIYILL